MGYKHQINNDITSKVITYDYDPENGTISIYANLKLIVVWVVDGGEDEIPAHINDFNSILDLGIDIGKVSLVDNSIPTSKVEELIAIWEEENKPPCCEYSAEYFIKDLKQLKKGKVNY